MNGLHLTADLRGCSGALGLLSDPQRFELIALSLTELAGLAVVSSHWHRFASCPGAEGVSGFTGVLLLAESHLAVHTWPELSGVTLDVYVCNYSGDNTAKARALMGGLVAAFGPDEVSQHELVRGFGGGVGLTHVIDLCCGS